MHYSWGPGAAGVAVARILMSEGLRSIVSCDRFGAIHSGRHDYEDGSMNAPKTSPSVRTTWSSENGKPLTRQ